MEYSAVLEHSWPFQNLMTILSDHSDLMNMDISTQIGSSDFSSLFFNSNDYSDLSESFPSFFGDTLIEASPHLEEFPMNLQEFDPNLMIDGLYGDFSEGSFLLQQVSTQQLSIEGADMWSPNSFVTDEASSKDSTSIRTSSPILPREEVENYNESTIHHLLQAYAEAMQNGQKELQKVILRCLREKVRPIGQTLERLAFHLSQDVDDQQGGAHHLKQESYKTFELAFKLFYQNFPYGRFAHYAANTAILEAIPEDAETAHIVDFDMGEGLQLPQIIEALAQRFKTLRVTAIKWGEEESDCAPPHPRFEETRKQLQNHARSFGLNLRVEEVSMEDLVSETKKSQKRGGGKEFLAFNCMVSLPHMRRRRSRRHVMEFLCLAKEIMANSGNTNAGKRSILTLGDGDACAKLGSDTSFSSFFQGNLLHYQTLLESIELTFPSHLAEARTVMELIFLAPYVSSEGWSQNWTELKEDCHVQQWLGFEGRRLSKENLMEAKLIVGDESYYGIGIGGKNGNQMAIEWKGKPLVRVSTWENQS